MILVVLVKKQEINRRIVSLLGDNLENITDFKLHYIQFPSARGVIVVNLNVR